jgi:two-component system, OmpR family, heavy metal sensor histidine kinase CusS
MRSAPRLISLFRTLRFRLTMWNTSVVLMAILVSMLSVREGLRFYLITEMDTVLEDEVRELMLAIERWHPDREQIIGEMHRKTLGHQARDWHISWLDPSRTETLWASANAPPLPLRTLVTKHGQRQIWVSTTHRAVECQLQIPGLPGYYVRVGTPTSFIDADVSRLTAQLIPIALVILLLAPLGGYLLAERAVEPLQQLIASTARLRPGNLNERLRLRGVKDELDQLAAQINQFLDQIAEHVNRHRDFVAHAAHELRSPLTAIQASIDVAREKPRPAEEYQELLAQVLEESRQLSQLVNQLLELADVESGLANVEKSPVAFSDIVQRTVDMFAAVADERGIQLRSSVARTPLIHAVPLQIRQVASNLIDNALKFTPSGKTIDVKLESDERLRCVRLTVSDTGPGIPADHLPRIFDRFYQVDPARRRDIQTRGNGLGLSIVKAIVEHHGGSITAASQLGVGSQFIVTLPWFTPADLPAEMPNDPTDRDAWLSS